MHHAEQNTATACSALLRAALQAPRTAALRLPAGVCVWVPGEARDVVAAVNDEPLTLRGLALAAAMPVWQAALGVGHPSPRMCLVT